jgi:hypothetical protein
MEQFTQLFGRLLALVYHCFDRIVILGHLPLLTRPENIVHFVRDGHGVRAITKAVLRERTDAYHRWVETFARHHQIPIEWGEKGVRKEAYVLPFLQRMERRHRFGVYFTLIHPSANRKRPSISKFTLNTAGPMPVEAFMEVKSRPTDMTACRLCI